MGKKCWSDGIKIHPAAELFPMMDDEQFERHIKSLEDHGQLEPCVFLDGQLLDGRNTYKAQIERGVKPDIVKLTGKEIPDPWVYSIQKNLDRRHLTASQRAMVGVSLKAHYNEIAKQSQEQSSSHEPKTPPSGGGSNNKTGTAPHSGVANMSLKKRPKASEREAAAAVGAVVGVSATTIRKAETVSVEGSKAVQEAVASNEIDVTKAAALIKAVPDKREQTAAIRHGKAGVDLAIKQAKEKSAASEPQDKSKIARSNLSVTRQHLEQALRAVDDYNRVNANKEKWQVVVKSIKHAIENLWEVK